MLTIELNEENIRQYFDLIFGAANRNPFTDGSAELMKKARAAARKAQDLDQCWKVIGRIRPGYHGRDIAMIELLTSSHGAFCIWRADGDEDSILPEDEVIFLVKGVAVSEYNFSLIQSYLDQFKRVVGTIEEKEDRYRVYRFYHELFPEDNFDDLMVMDRMQLKNID